MNTLPDGIARDALYSPIPTPYTLLPTRYTLRPTRYTLHPQRYTLPPFTLHPAPASASFILYPQRLD